MTIIETQLAQLRCDNTECGYVVPEGELAWGRELIGYNCPDCMSDMLTEKDFLISDAMSNLLSDSVLDSDNSIVNDTIVNPVFVDIKDGGVSLKYESGRAYDISGGFVASNSAVRLGKE